ncbi:MAG: outer membrane beta-barrel protein [Cyclobacteriaceae bacterium]
MHIRIILFISSLLIYQASKSQNNEIKLNLGANRSNVISNPKDIFSIEDGFKTGINTELIFKHSFQEPFYSGGGLGFIQKGYKFNIHLTDENGENLSVSKSSLTLNYLTIPLYFGIETGENFYFMASFGITPSILLKATLDSELPNWGGEATDQTDRFDLTAQLRLGVGKNLNRQFRMEINVAFHQSLIQTDFNNNNASNQDQYNNLGTVFNLGLGYKIVK